MEINIASPRENIAFWEGLGILYQAQFRCYAACMAAEFVDRKVRTLHSSNDVWKHSSLRRDINDYLAVPGRSVPGQPGNLSADRYSVNK
jgi:hypothetical protein